MRPSWGLSLLYATTGAALVAVGSIASGQPGVWPGTLLTFLFLVLWARAGT